MYVYYVEKKSNALSDVANQRGRLDLLLQIALEC